MELSLCECFCSKLKELLDALSYGPLSGYQPKCYDATGTEKPVRQGTCEFTSSLT
jgi:hypothetical protein